MNSHQKELIKATIPILRASGNYFYARMFREHPELRNMFNMGNQANGRQKSALANAVLSYAENIDDTSVLIGVLKGKKLNFISVALKCSLKLNMKRYSI